jgi:hypothetical protein
LTICQLHLLGADIKLRFGDGANIGGRQLQGFTQ